MKLSDFSKMKNLKTDVHTMSLNFSQHKDELISIIENDKSWEPTTDGVVYTNLFTTYRTGWHIHKNYSLFQYQPKSVGVVFIIKRIMLENTIIPHTHGLGVIMFLPQRVLHQWFFLLMRKTQKEKNGKLFQRMIC